MRKEKKIALTIGGIVVALLVVLLVAIGLFQSGTEKLDGVFDSLLDLDFKTDQIDMDIKSDHLYGEVEERVKTYLQSYVTAYQDLLAIIREEDFIDFLQPNRFTKAVDWKALHSRISEWRNRMQQDYDLLQTYGLDATIRENGKELEGNYLDLYLGFMISHMSEDRFLTIEKEASTYIDMIARILNVYEQVLLLLEENPTAWSVVDGTFTFTNAEVERNYQQRLQQLS